MRLPAGPKRLYIDRPAAACGQPAIVVELVETGERFHASERADWGSDSLRRNPEFPAAPAFYVETNEPVTLT